MKIAGNPVGYNDLPAMDFMDFRNQFLLMLGARFTNIHVVPHDPSIDENADIWLPQREKIAKTSRAAFLPFPDCFDKVAVLQIEMFNRQNMEEIIKFIEHEAGRYYYEHELRPADWHAPEMTSEDYYV